MLASIIEKLSGLSYNDYIQKNIFKPLGIKSSHVYNTRRSSQEIIPNYAYGFVYSDSLKKYTPPDALPEYDFVIYLAGIVGDVSVNSTTGDLLKWDRAIKNHTLISEATQNEMLSPQSLIDTASKNDYGYGEMLGKNEIGNYINTQADGLVTALCLGAILQTIITLSNNECNSSQLARPLAYTVTDRQTVPLYKHETINIDTLLFDKYAGKYLVPNMPNPIKMELFKKKGKLFYRYENRTIETELKPESSTKFFDNGSDMQIEFQMSSTSEPLKTFLIFSGMKKEIKKLSE